MTIHISSEQRPLEIFLIEDNLADAVLMKEGMKKSKYDIHLTIARDGEAALERLERRGDFSGRPLPDLIILDLNLPKIDGRDLLSVIRDDPDFRETPVLVWTVSGAEEDVISSYQHHANLFLRKPRDLDELFTTFQYIDDFWLGKMTSAHPKGNA
jgi:chemotaxis family two-component system response regulator Rcp1